MGVAAIWSLTGKAVLFDRNVFWQSIGSPHQEAFPGEDARTMTSEAIPRVDFVFPTELQAFDE